MIQPIHLCIVGAGSCYTPELIDGILSREDADLPIASLRLMDTDPKRLAVMAGLSERMLRHRERGIPVRSGTRLEPLLEGANFVITQIRVGGMAARRLDETIPLRYGIIGQETTGPGGMCKALRTIPPMLDIARSVERVAPAAVILNYTNPSGIITEAVTRYTGARLVGLCSGMPGIRQELARRLGPRYPGLQTYCVGLNHLGFVHRILSEGRDVTGEAIERLCAEDEREATDNAEMALPRVTRALGAVPISYALYYLRRSDRLKEAADRKETRADTVARVEREILEESARPETVTRPEALDRRGGHGYAAITFSVLHAILHNTGDELAMSVPNRGAVAGIAADAAVEVVCRVDASGATPLPVGPIPPAFRGLVLAVKAYETLTVEAAVRRERRLVKQALVNDPLVGDLDVIDPLVEEMLAAHGLAFS